MTGRLFNSDQQERTNQVFQELRQMADQLDAELASVYPDRQFRRRKVFELLGLPLQHKTIQFPGGRKESLPYGGPILASLRKEEPELYGEILGQVLETLIREADGKAAGTYYTSREVVTLMCRLALWSYLGNKLDLHGFTPRELGRLIFQSGLEPATAYGEREESRKIRGVVRGVIRGGIRREGAKSRSKLLTLLRQVRVIDPAAGSGAFLLGMLSELSLLRAALGENLSMAAIRQQVLKQNIFGVEREAAAIEVLKSRLHLFAGAESTGVVCGDSLFLDWEQHFPQVMSGGGFDIVLANPPYVSWDRLDKSYKNKLTQAFMPKGLAVGSKTDLYVYFYALAAQILGTGGTGAIISSTAWLDVEYGAELQKFLLDNFTLQLVLDSSLERWFGEAAVNTAIVLLSRCRLQEQGNWTSTGSGDKRGGTGGIEGTEGTAFLTLRRSLRAIMESPEQTGKLIEEVGRILGGKGRSWENICLRVNLIDQGMLKSDGLTEEPPLILGGEHQLPGYPANAAGTQGKYGGAKWGKYLRAPGVYFRLRQLCADKLCYLGDIARIKRGFTTGCNEFFYLRSGQPDPVEERYLRPVVKSPREISGFTVEREKLQFKVFLVPDGKEPLEPEAAAYIQEGEIRGYNLRPSLAAKNPWWQLVKTEFPVLIFRRFFNEKFNLPYLSEEIAEDQTFYGVYYLGDPLILAAIMNSTLTWLFIELHGRTALGEGVLQYAVYEAAGLPVINPAGLGLEAREQLRDIFRQMGNRKVLGLAEELAAPDRRLLDRVLLQELGITWEAGTESFQEELYREFLQLVRNRLEKAKKPAARPLVT